MFVMFFGIGSSIIYQFVYDSAILKNNKTAIISINRLFCDIYFRKVYC